MSLPVVYRNGPTRPLSAAAFATNYFEKRRIFNSSSEISLGERLASHHASGAFQAMGVTTNVKNYILKNVMLDATTLILFQDGLPIPETAYFVPDGAPISGGPVVTLNADETIIIGYNNAHHGYQHWLAQCIPAIDWSLRQNRTGKVRLLLPRLDNWQQDLLNILGYGGIPRLTPEAGTRYLLPGVEFCDFLNGSASFDISQSMMDTVHHILRASPTFPSSAAILYMTGGPSYYGSIRNEAEVVDLLRGRGVTIVDRAKLGTAERINLFRHAEAVIGPLGESLTDIVFCGPVSLLWEWMPRHHQNASYNRLAQAAGVDYWGDMFESVINPARPGEWEVDLAVVARRLTELHARLGLARQNRLPHAAHPPLPTRRLLGPPIEDLMLGFESLGDNCEFGLVQRHAGVEPLGLLRFAGIHLENLVAGLRSKFAGLGAPGSIHAYLAGEPGRREILVHETTCDLRYHTFITEHEMTLADFVGRETTRLGFLRRKLLEDLEAGEKVWVWRSHTAQHREQIEPLLEILRSLGPNKLLWVVEATGDHASGTIEPLAADCIKGYVERFAPYEAATDISPASWLEMCSRAHEWPHPEASPTELQATTAGESATDDRAPKAAASAEVGSEPAKRTGLFRWLRRKATGNNRGN